MRSDHPTDCPGDDTQFRKALAGAVQDLGLPPLGEEQTSALESHYRLMCRWNRHVNLTRITEPEDAARLHYAESLFGATFIGNANRVLDIGSGAGFPALPMAIARPDVEVTALEPDPKKALFLHEVKDLLSLGNLTVTRARIEEFDSSGYDLLTSRALEQAEKHWRSIIEKLAPGQRLMLFCGESLAGRLEQSGDCRIERWPVPTTESRLVLIAHG